jgi:hypothetical protein
MHLKAASLLKDASLELSPSEVAKRLSDGQ